MDVRSTSSRLYKCQPLSEYPRCSGQFSFDTICEKILTILEENKWQVPGIERRIINDNVHIVGENFHLGFRLNKVFLLTIPKKSLEVFPDETGPDYRIYAGKDWENDRKSFMGLGPTPHIRYKGSSELTQEVPDKKGIRNPYIAFPYRVTSLDYYQENYQTEEWYKDFYLTEEVYQEFATYLEVNVLPKLL